MGHLPMSEIPEACPGTQSETAGKSSACEGCPNQQVCSSGTLKGPDPDISKVKERMQNVKHKILVLSGKGGVGKSTFSTQLSRALAFSEQEVGLLDIDICGPSIPKMAGAEGQQVHMSNDGWTPVYVEENLAVMSIAFMLESPDDAVIWRGPKKNGLIKQFLKDVNWSTIDYLVVDTPPGTSDEHLSIVQYLSAAGIDGAVIVTTPQEVALLDVRKEINFCKKVNVKVLGVVENMSGFVCPNCKNETQIFAPTTGGAQQMAKEMNVPFLGQIPIDPHLARCCDQGLNFFEEYPSSPAVRSLQSIIGQIRHQVEGKQVSDNV